MATTTNYGWTTPNDTDLVKDGAAAIRTLGSSVDTSMADLLGGTTGQVLAKASDTDMDFVWSADAAGMTNPMTTTGDTIYSSSGSTPARLGVGTTGDVLTVAGGVPTWAAPAGGGKVLQVVQGTYSTLVSNSTDTYADTGLTATITPSSATSKILVFANHNARKSADNSTNGLLIKLLRDSTEIIVTTIMLITESTLFNQAMIPIHYLDSPATTSAVTYKTQFRNFPNTASVSVQANNATSTLILMEIGA